MIWSIPRWILFALLFWAIVAVVVLAIDSYKLLRDLDEHKKQQDPLDYP